LRKAKTQFDHKLAELESYPTGFHVADQKAALAPAVAESAAFHQASDETAKGAVATAAMIDTNRIAIADTNMIDTNKMVLYTDATRWRGRKTYGLSIFLSSE
jgi:hypothetical protein